MRYVNSYPEFVDFLTSRTKRVSDATLVGHDFTFLQYQLIDDAADAPRKPKVLLAAFITSYARIILLNKMQLVEDWKNVLYCDTDSIIFFRDKEEWELLDILIVSSLSEMNDEFPNDVLTDKYLRAGPNFYCLWCHNVNSGLEYKVFKMKRLTLKSATENTFNLETFKKLILGETH